MISIVLLVPLGIWLSEPRREPGRSQPPVMMRTYIRCLKDLAVPPDRALIYAQRLGVKPIDLDAGHDAMLSQPEAVAQILDRL